MPRLFSVLTLLAVLGPCLQAQVSVTTWRNDTQRTGQNLNETILTPSNVNPTQFGQLFSQPVDGFVYAQPLYLPSVTVGGKTHNVVFVATENDSVYAFDADNNGSSNASPLWFASMLTVAHGAGTGETTVPSSVLGTDIEPQVGITGTPVIDPSTGTLYVVSKTMTTGSAFIQRLHALDVTTGLEKFGGPVVITATVSGTGNGSTSGSLTFDSEWENQRPALLLMNGVVYIGFAAHGDVGPWHGWILGYSASTLQQTGAFCASPNGVGAGFWMSGAGLSAEIIDPVNHPYGRMFVATGNGDYTASTPYAAGMDFGDSILNLDLTNGDPTIQDEFTPKNQSTLDAGDGDLGSSGILILPTQTAGSYPHLLVQAGKTGEVFLLNREGLGGYNTTTDQVVQELPSAVGDSGTWAMPAYWNGSVYYVGRGDVVKEFSLVNGLLTGPTYKSTDAYNYPGSNPVISANGTGQGILWTVNSSGYPNDTPSILEAYSAASLGTAIYTSSSNASRDNPGAAVKFTVPTVANGKVYLGAQKLLSVYGLLSGGGVTAAPTFSPGAESFSGTASVTLSDSTAGATIYYTTNGTTPTASSSVYTTPITVSATTTIEAMASAPGYDQSAVSSAAYTLSTQAATPVISPGTSTIPEPVSVTITDATGGATIYYTTNGSTPTTASTKYTGAVTVSSSETLNAIAAASGLSNSDVASATYTLDSGATGINFPVGFADSGGLIALNGVADLDDSRLQMTDGNTNEASTAWFYQPVNIQSFNTTFSFQLSNPVGNGVTFAIQGNSISALGNTGSGLGFQWIPNSLAIKFDFNTVVGAGTDSTGLFTQGGLPTAPAIDLTTTGINLQSDDLFDVAVTYNGSVMSMTITDTVTGAAYSTSWYVNIPSIVGGDTAFVGFTGGAGTTSSSQKLLTWVYNTGSTAAPLSTTPIFSPAGGNYATSQSVTMSSLTSGAQIYYTTNGSTPTTSSTLYSGPVTVSSTSTLKAIAVATHFGSSTVGTAAYTVGANPAAAIPAFSPSGGHYSTAQSVTINESTPNATIYYTTDGSTPNTLSSVYSGAIAVSSSQTLQAIAIAPSYSQSKTIAATYMFPTATPAISPAAGNYSPAPSVTLTDATPSATIYYTTNGTNPSTSSTVYSAPFTVTNGETVKTMAVAPNDTQSSIAIANYGVRAAPPTLSPGSGSYTGATQVTMTDTTPGAAIYYTTDGTTPTTSSAVYSGAITISASSTVQAVASSSGYANSAATMAAITITTSGVAAMPTFSLPPGGYTTAQTVTISAPTAGTTIYYTTNGTTPTTSSSVYGGVITVGATETLQAIAAGNGYSASPVAAATYSIGPPAAIPAFAPSGGHYSTAQSVTINESTPNATIYYTTNGTQPTTSSTLYTGAAIPVSSSKTLEAIAIAPNYSQSRTITAIYEFPTATPAFSVAAGTYTSAQQVTLSDATPGASIYYTLNGTNPSTASTLYTGAITVSATETIKATALAPNDTQSSIAIAYYTISAP